MPGPSDAFMAAAILVSFSCGCGGSRTLGRAKAESMIRASASLTSQSPARRHITKIEGVAVNGDGVTAAVPFEWYFESNIEGFPRDVAGVTQKATAHFRLWDDGWRLDEKDLAGQLWSYSAEGR